ncbi:MAG TPA: nuclear transport factor 2 family protein [Terriglobales bacterium]|nr:nuclear transport factor 2 family protein [Terriglobales bacterium]
MSRRFGRAVFIATLAGMLSVIMQGCSSKLAEPEPIPEAVVNDLAAKENGLWSALKQKDRQQLNKLLAYDYMTVGDSGPMDKETKIASVDDQKITEFSIRDLRATLLGSNYVLLTYRCSSKGERHGRAIDENYLCSDIWISRGGAWQSIFFEDRPVSEQSFAALDR